MHSANFNLNKTDMKKILKLAAMFAAALAICVACTEKVEDDAPLSIDGKQWCFESEWMEVAPAVLDLGATEAGVLKYGIKEGDAYVANAYFDAAYTIEPIDETSGVIKYTILNGRMGFEIAYKNLTKTSVVLDGDDMYGIGKDITATVATQPITIVAE